MSETADPWIRVGIAASASILGSLMIYIDVVWNKFSRKEFSILDSKGFIGVALSMSCGTLLVTALNGLLPRAVDYIENGHANLTSKQANGLLVPFFATGVLLCQFMNFVVLRYSSRSAVTCSHDLDNATRTRKNTSPGVHERLPLLHDQHEHSYVHDNEATHQHNTNNQCDSHASSLVGESDNNLHTAGYSSAPFTIDEEHAVHAHQSQISVLKSGSSADLLAIGLQTTLGISIHRVPEGLLLFAASQTDRQLGISIVLSLTFHSFSEGFSIAAPLYGALHRRGLVLLISALLGCGPQVVGALIGSFLFAGKSTLSGTSMFAFGVGMAVTAGFMTVVCIQMIGSAYRYMSQTAVLYGVVFGVLLSLASRAI